MIKDPGKGRLQKGDNLEPRISVGQCKLLTYCIFSFFFQELTLTIELIKTVI